MVEDVCVRIRKEQVIHHKAFIDCSKWRRRRGLGAERSGHGAETRRALSSYHRLPMEDSARYNQSSLISLSLPENIVVPR